jgi:mannose-6-phosphate isomerase
MALAVTPFEALCGFRPVTEIAAHLEQYPEFADVVGQDVTSNFVNTVKKTGNTAKDNSVAQNKAALKSLFAALMTKDQDQVTKLLAKLVERVSSQAGILPELITRLDQQYPGGDIGVFSVLLLNYIKLSPGDAIFLGANEPHAYLSGGMLEAEKISQYLVLTKLVSSP